MKVRESGMPEATFWASLFDLPLILDAMGIDGGVNDVAIQKRKMATPTGAADRN
jgi:hypothetical protein